METETNIQNRLVKEHEVLPLKSDMHNVNPNLLSESLYTRYKTLERGKHAAQRTTSHTLLQHQELGPAALLALRRVQQGGFSASWMRPWKPEDGEFADESDSSRLLLVARWDGRKLM
jgi:hypothetical protein